MSLLVVISVSLLSIVQGYKLEPKIYMGSKSSGKPWLVALRRFKDQVCGGTLYTKSLVISAAHCVNYKPGEWRAYINQYDLNQTNEVGSSSYKVLAFQKNPYYVDGHHHYDVSAWWIDSGSSDRTSVVLDNGSGANDKTRLVDIAGWGKTERRKVNGKFTKDELPELLHEAKVPLNDDSKCIAMHPQEYDPSMMLCTGHFESNSDSCQGDSGGPIYRTNGNQIILIGIISHGRGCGDHGYYSQDVRISNPHIKKFIKKYEELYDPENLINTPGYKPVQENPQQTKLDPLIQNANPSPEIRPKDSYHPNSFNNKHEGFPGTPNSMAPSFRSIQTTPSFRNPRPGTRTFETNHSYSHEKRTDSNGIAWERDNGGPWYQSGGDIQSNQSSQYFTSPSYQPGFNPMFNPDTPTIFQTTRLHSPDSQFNPFLIQSSNPLMANFPQFDFQTQTGFPSIIEQSNPTFGTHTTNFGSHSLGGSGSSYSSQSHSSSGSSYGSSFSGGSSFGGNFFGSGSSFGGHLFRRSNEGKEEKREPVRIY